MALEDNETGFQLYLREIAKFPLLTHAEEVKLAKRIKGDDLRLNFDPKTGAELQGRRVQPVHRHATRVARRPK